MQNLGRRLISFRILVLVVLATLFCAQAAQASSVGYYPNGAISGYWLANGKSHTLTQNTRGLPYQNADSGVLQDVYSYDANANIASITDQIAGKNRAMAYDGLDRLIVANAPAIWGNGGYAYDVLDNITQSTVGSRNTSHNYDSQNRLASLNTNGAYSGFTYDNQGNITAKGYQGYYFDQGNRMVLAQRYGSPMASYYYDGLGRRLYASSRFPQPSRTTLYSQGGQMLYSTAQQGWSVTNTRYVYLGGKLIAEDGTLGVVYNHTDALGSPVARTNASGQTITTTSYEPYGKTAAGTDPAMVGFTGHVNDPDTGLVYMQQRYYDPIASRFMSEDAVTTDGDTGGHFGRFHYANNNPYRYTDPDGRDPNVALFDPMDYLKTLAIESVKFIAMAAGGAGGGAVKGVEVLGVAAKGAEAASAGAKVAEVATAAKGGTQAVELTAAQAKNVERFTGKLPVNAKDSVTLKELPNGGVAAQGTSPGRVPGSSAVYEKQIDAAGKTTQYTKTTNDPAGNIVHVKDKITGAEYKP